MKGSNNSINVISLESMCYTRAVCDALAGIGHSVRVIDPQHWLSTGVDDCADTSVLVLTAQSVPEKKYSGAITQRLSLSPHLALYSYPLSQELQSIVLLCQECCGWPCEQQELALHLERLSPQKSNPKGQVLDTNDSTDWLSLKLLGVSPAFRKMQSIIKKSASCDAAILIDGETGSGKEVAARAVHYLGARRDHPFIPVNCGAIPDHLIENELFGHEKGAYTDARQNHAGLIAQADGGTLFLDEIEALSLKGQVTLLRFLEDKKIKPLGGKQSRQVNVRIIAAGNEPLSGLVAQKKFRQDLLFRLDLLSMKLPPLRDRRTDIQYLAEHFLQQHRQQYQRPNVRLHPNAVAWMNQYHWPGNVRELENFIHRGVLLSEDNWIMHTGDNLDNDQSNDRRNLIDLGLSFGPGSSYNEAKHIVLNQFEESYLTGLMSRTNGNVTKAAGLAHKERRALGKLLKKHAIDPAQYRTSQYGKYCGNRPLPQLTHSSAAT